MTLNKYPTLQQLYRVYSHRFNRWERWKRKELYLIFKKISEWSPWYSCVRFSLRFRLPDMVITVLCPLGTSCTLKHQHASLEEGEVCRWRYYKMLQWILRLSVHVQYPWLQHLIILTKQMNIWLATVQGDFQDFKGGLWISEGSSGKTRF